MGRRRPSFRALVIVPRSVRDQWREELRARFGLTSHPADRLGLETAAAKTGGRNPWAGAGIWIGSADYLKQPHVLDSIPAMPWDLVVIDEAHDVCGQSVRHELCDELSRRARHVLLLTATPHVGDRERYERLRALGQLPNLSDSLIAFRRTRGLLGLTTRRHVRWLTVPLTGAEHAVLETLTAFERAVLAHTTPHAADGLRLLLSIFRKRALSSMAALLITLERRLTWISGRGEDLLEWLQPRLQFDDPDDARADDDCSALTAESGLAPNEERRWLRRLRALTIAAARRDSKIHRLARTLERTTAPVLVFTEFRHSLEAIRTELDRRLHGRRRVAVLHGGHSAHERSVAIGTFERGDASVLLATDVASQGLNLQQRARWVISVELPWTPARLEQRIGRVDRIGQRLPVHATLLVANHPAEGGLLRRLAQRTLAITRAVGDGVHRTLEPPSERAVALALFAGADAPAGASAAAPSLVTPSVWCRRARAIAALTVNRRGWRRRWRGLDGGIARPRVTTLRARRPRHRAAALVSVVIVDGTAAPIERRLLHLGFDNGDPAAIAAVIRSSAFRQWLAGRLRPRLRRLERLRSIVSDAQGPIEQAIASHLAHAGVPEELQRGLFDRRAEHAFNEVRDEVSEIERRAYAELRACESRRRLELAPPRLELLFRWPRH
jgi:hypothetical protein